MSGNFFKHPLTTGGLVRTLAGSTIDKAQAAQPAPAPARVPRPAAPEPDTDEEMRRKAAAARTGSGAGATLAGGYGADKLGAG